MTHRGDRPAPGGHDGGQPDGFDRELAEVYRRQAPMLRAVARAIVHDEHAADDVVQQSFERVVQLHRRGAGPSGDLAPYLVATVRHRALNLRARRREHPTDSGVLAALPAAGTPESVLVANEEDTAALAAYWDLPPAERDALSLHLDGMRRAEAARRTGLTLGGLDSRLARAREALRVGYVARAVPEVHGDGHPERRALVRYVRASSGAREAERVRRHLDDCGPCTQLIGEVARVNHTVAGVGLPIVVLGLLGRRLRITDAPDRGAQLSGLPLVAAGALLLTAAFVAPVLPAPSSDGTVVETATPVPAARPTLDVATPAPGEPGGTGARTPRPDGAPPIGAQEAAQGTSPATEGDADSPSPSHPLPGHVEVTAQWDSATFAALPGPGDLDVAGAIVLVDLWLTGHGEGERSVVDVELDLPTGLVLDPRSSPQCTTEPGGSVRCGRLAVAGGDVVRASVAVTVDGPVGEPTPPRPRYVG